MNNDTYTYLVGGVSDTERRMLTQVTALHAGVSTRTTALAVPGVHGAQHSERVTFDPPSIAMEWELVAPSWSDLDQEHAVLAGLLARPGDVELTRRVLDVVGVATDQHASARLKSIAEIKGSTASPLILVTALLELPSVFWRGAVVTSAPIAATTDTSAVVPSLNGSTAPVVDAVLRVTGPAASIDVRDPATGTGLSWTGTLTAGQYLYLDAAQLRAWTTTSASAWAATESDVSTGLDYPAPGPLELWPTNRTVSVAVTGTGRSATTALAVRAAPAYL